MTDLSPAVHVNETGRMFALTFDAGAGDKMGVFGQPVAGECFVTSVDESGVVVVHIAAVDPRTVDKVGYGGMEAGGYGVEPGEFFMGLVMASLGTERGFACEQHSIVLPFDHEKRALFIPIDLFVGRSIDMPCFQGYFGSVGGRLSDASDVGPTIAEELLEEACLPGGIAQVEAEKELVLIAAATFIVFGKQPCSFFFETLAGSGCHAIESFVRRSRTCPC